MGGESSNELLKYLQNDASGRGELDELIQRFCEMVKRDQFKIPMVCFYENLPTDFTQVIKHLPSGYRKMLDSNNRGIVSMSGTRVLPALTVAACPATFGLPSGPAPDWVGRSTRDAQQVRGPGR